MVGLSLRGRKLARTAFILGVVLLAYYSLALHAEATAGINQQVNYQARLLSTSGAVVPDGTYNLEFKIYQDGTGCVAGGTVPCGGTLLWTESRIGANKVIVKNGYFTVQLGAVTPFGTSIDWNQDTLWLSVNVGGTDTPTWDGEMTPLRRLSASPYALNAGQLGGRSAAEFLQLAPSTVQTESSTNNAIFINKTGASGNIVQLQKAGSDVLTLNNSGSLLLKNTATTAFQTQNALGTPVFTVDTANSRVGIGAVTPTEALHLDGKLRFVSSSETAWTGNAKLFVGDQPDTAARGSLSGPSLTNISTYGNGAGAVPGLILQWGGATDAAGIKLSDDGLMVWGAGDEQVFSVLDEDANAFRLVVDDTGDVGIGTATPGHKLDVVGDANLSTGSAFKINGSNILTAGALSFTTAATATIQSASSQALTLTAHAASIWSTSSGALTLQGAGGVNINSTAGSIGIGAADTTGTLLVLDTKTGAGDPTGTNGGMYYNANSSKFRCFQSSAWTDCIGTGGGGGGYATIQDEGSALTQRTTLNFTGGGIDCADNSGSSKTDCSVAFTSGDGAGATASGSGFESGSGGFGLLQGCGDGQTLKWDDSAVEWKCGSDSASSQNRLDGDYTNTTTTFTNVDNNANASDSLSFDIGANETWIFFMNAKYSSPTAADSKWRITAPTGATCKSGFNDIEGAVTVDNVACSTSSGTIASTGAADSMFVSGTVVNGSTAGTVMLQFGQAAASGTSTIFAGSYVLAYRIDGADLAEIYHTEDTGVTPGTLVSLDPHVEAGVTKTSQSYDRRMLGIVSTQPGSVLGRAEPNARGAPVMVALAGRVPVRVSAENGSIQPGDYLTSSSVPGVAMKATEPGYVIAQALTPYSGSGEGTVVGFIKSTWYEPPHVSATDVQNSTISDLELEKLHINGTLVVTEDALFQGQVTVNELKITGHLVVSQDVAGTASIPAGETMVDVTFRRRFNTIPKIAATASDYVPIKIEQKSVEGFRLRIPSAQTTEIAIDWIALEVK